MKRCLLFLAACCAVQAHDIITTSITWSRDISRIVNNHCASCHHPGGRAFSLMTYAEARPWAVAIKEEILRRRMPPWGAIKGFGEFRNDQALTPEEMERIVSWSDGGVPEGEEKDLPPPPKSLEPEKFTHPKGEFLVSGELALARAFKVDGLWPEKIPEKGSFQITAQLPDGTIQPLLWLQDYKSQFGHPFLYRTPLNLPARTVIKGIPAGARIALLPAK
ncbi:MAG TPA: cytochrome c [Bryobacteraceae bacterium]|nr:cytochrome c [Bryobacteraceae bacterium]